jgi:hypothetical protein
MMCVVRFLDELVAYVEFPSGGHTFFRRDTRLAYYAIIETLLAQHLGGACEPLGEDVRSPIVGQLVGGAEVRGLARQVEK